MHSPLPDLDRHFALPAVRRVALDRPLFWLAQGWRDLRRNPLPSLAYGLLFGLGGDAILLASLGRHHLTFAAVSGFFLVAPLLAAGLYELSRQGEQGRRVGFVDSCRRLKPRAEGLAQFGLVLCLVALVWERVSAIVFAFLGTEAIAEPGIFLGNILTNPDYRGLIATWFVLGGALAVLVFALSVVAVPMILDRNCDPVTAMATSLRVFAVNMEVLVLWAALIVALTLLGFATLLFGLVLFMPLLGHATWHAYRDLVE